MPTENENKVEDLIDVGEADQQETEINLDDKGEPEKIEAPVEEKIEVEEVSEVDKTFENERETKLKKPEEKDELKEYSDGVQKRIAKLTRKMREAERQREEAIAFAEATHKQKNELEGRLSKLDKSYTSEFETRVKTNMAAAKLALKNAIESQNVEAQIAAQEQIANLTMDGARLNAMKVAEESKPEPVKDINITPQRQAEPIPTDAKAEEWASRNTWFGNDSAMTYTAFDLHKTLVEQEGYDPKSDEYYAEVDKRIRLEFPHKFDKVEDTTTERAKPAQNVASARRSASTGRKKTVKLTPSQVAIAKRLGVPLEDYAKQLKITEGA
jgi:hypothetical protein